MKVFDNEKCNYDVYSDKGKYHKISGWMKNFFLYDKNGTLIFDKNKEELNIINLPPSQVKSPVKLTLLDDNGKITETLNLTFLAGFTGVLMEND